MLRNTILATAAAATLLSGAAFAQTGPVLNGGGDDRTITYDGARAPQGNVVGGGYATVAGGGDNRVISYFQPIAPRSNLVATVTGGGNDRVITYAPADGARGGMLAGEAGSPRG